MPVSRVYFGVANLGLLLRPINQVTGLSITIKSNVYSFGL